MNMDNGARNIAIGLGVLSVLNELASRTGSRRRPGVYYHVTSRQNAQAIRKGGFHPDWGDVGLGVYFFGTLISAQQYAEKGGWDGLLKDPVILAVYHPDIRPIYSDEIHPDWPDPEKYWDIYFWESDDEEEIFVPDSLILEQVK